MRIKNSNITSTLDPKRYDQIPEHRSEEVQEILGQIPSWTIRWGITIFFLIIILLLTSSWFIRFPTTIKSRVLLTTKIPPSSLIARADGQLKLFINNNASVKAGNYLALIKNPASFESVKELEEFTRTFRLPVNHMDKRIDIINSPDITNIGELQPSYAAFLSKLNDYNRSHILLSQDQQIKNIDLQIRQYENLTQQHLKQKKILSEELKLSQKRLDVDKKLFEGRVLSDAELDKSKSTTFQAQRNYELSQNSIINNQVMISQLNSQINDLLITKTGLEDQLRTDLEITFKDLVTQIGNWKLRYLLQAPIDGIVSFTKYRSDYQFVKAGDEVLTVVPREGDLYCEVQMPVIGSGKVSIGQLVDIRFDNYPSTEYGIVRGKVDAISALPRENKYIIRIQLPQGLTTSYHKKLLFKQEMQGDAEIITENLRLIERIFNQFRALIDKTSL